MLRAPELAGPFDVNGRALDGFLEKCIGLLQHSIPGLHSQSGLFWVVLHGCGVSLSGLSFTDPRSSCCIIRAQNFLENPET